MILDVGSLCLEGSYEQRVRQAQGPDCGVFSAKPGQQAAIFCRYTTVSSALR
jgi:hypothetical protein